jgi:hypothetical protein
MDTPKQVSFSADDFAKRHGIGRTTVFSEIKAGRLQARKVGKRTLVTAEDERAWLACLPKARESVAA